MNKLTSLALATALSGALLAQPAISQESIVVTPEPSHEQFVEAVSRDLDRQLIMAVRREDRVPSSGIAIVRFQRDASGEPIEVAVYRPSGQRKLDRVAVRAVEQLGSLEAVPMGVEADQTFQANIVFAASQREFEKLSRQLAKEETARIAANPAAAGKVIAVGSIAAPPNS